MIKSYSQYSLTSSFYTEKIQNRESILYICKLIIGVFSINLKDLSPELQQKAKACKTAEELKRLAQENGFELSDEE